jgi:thiamine pyrophosphokinase
MNENKVLKDSLENIEKQHIKELSRQKQKSEKLETDLSSLQSELTDKQAVRINIFCDTTCLERP